MIIGFTGSRLGMSQNQKNSLVEYLTRFKNFINEFHHGDCVGADSEADDIAKSMGFKIFIHPPADTKLRAYKQGHHFFPPMPYLQRNKEIVRVSTVLVAAPDSDIEIHRSGTWQAIRFAKKNGVVVKQLLV